MYRGGLLTKNKDRTYVPSFKLVEYGSIILKRINIRDLSQPHLVDLMVKTGQTVHLVVKDGNEGVYIEKIEGPNSLPMLSRIGMRMNLYATGFGKAILANLSEQELEEYLKTVKLEKRGKNTVTAPLELKKQLNQIKKMGYAIDNEENENGIFCIGAPIFDYNKKVNAAVSISMSASKKEDPVIEKYIFYVKDCAKKISKLLGYKD
ncbi:IclR family transcriptional regulator [Petrotoga sp. 9PWA.NaAc.5.4]|nr:IclR family transcriptional regulator [Petrotoga sp. 9PWA.NaAc.5.4]